MTIGAVSADKELPREMQGLQRAAVSNRSAFSGVLLQTSSSSETDLDAIFEAAGLRYNLPPNLLKAVAKTESNFRPDAVSHAGAIGIMQLMPGTARGLGVNDIYDPMDNIMGGAKYLRQLIDRFGDLQLALAAYNAGPSNVTKYGGIPPFRETQNYVRKVLEYMDDDIVAGMTSSSSSNALDFGNFTQMLLIKVIEMQMNSSKDDRDQNVLF